MAHRTKNTMVWAVLVIGRGLGWPIARQDWNTGTETTFKSEYLLWEQSLHYYTYRIAGSLIMET